MCEFVWLLTAVENIRIPAIFYEIFKQINAF